jgi:putative Holliday junction resolvase
LVGYLETLLWNEGITEILVGMPRRLGGDAGFQAKRVLDKLNALRDRFSEVRFVEWDERFTTRVARSSPGVPRSGSHKGGGAGRRKGKGTGGRVDHLAAAVMLQEYLDRRGTFEATRQRPS